MAADMVKKTTDGDNVMALPIKNELAKPQLETGGKLAGIVPRNIDEIFRLASAIAQSGLAPKDMSTPERLTVAIMTGMELGLPPMLAINKIAIINGRPTVWGDAIPALLWSHGFKIAEEMLGEDDGRQASCTVTRPTGEKVTRTFGVREARKAGLWGKQGPWTNYSDRMLTMRARAFAARDGAADVLGGLYLKEELEDVPAEPRDVTPLAEVIAPEPKFKRGSGRSPDGRVTSYAAKKDGSDWPTVFNEIIQHFRASSDLKILDSLRDSYKKELDEMPTRWFALACEEFDLMWAKLGGFPGDNPMKPMEEKG